MESRIKSEFLSRLSATDKQMLLAHLLRQKTRLRNVAREEAASATFVDESLFRGMQFLRRFLLKLFRSGEICGLFVTRLAESFEYQRGNLGHIPRTQYVSIRYEDLCADPETCLDRMSRHLQLGLTPRIPPRFFAPRRLPLPDLVRRHYASRVEEMTRYLEDCGYPVCPEPVGATVPANCVRSR